MVTRTEVAVWNIQRAQSYDTLVSSRLDNMITTMSLCMLSYFALYTKFQKYEIGRIIMYSHPIIMVIILAIAQFNCITDSILSHRFHKNGQEILSQEKIYIVSDQPILLVSTLMWRALFLPFVFTLMWSFVMVDFGLGAAQYVITFTIVCNLMEMAVAVIFGLLNRRLIIKK